MLNHFGRSKLLACLAAMALLVPISSAVAQSDRDLRDENQRLTTEVKQLTRELDAAKARIEDLQRQVETLRTALATPRRSSSQRSPAPLKEEAVTIDESVPNASPRALLTALKASYGKAFADQYQGEHGSSEHTKYLRAVDRWAASANRDFLTKITWHVRVLDAQTTRAGRLELKVQAVDPKTKTKLGDPFVIALQRNAARRFAQLRQRDEADVFVLKGTLHPQVVFNPQLREAQPFDTRFIGAYAELRLTVDASSLLPPMDEDFEDEAAGNSGRSK